MKRQYRVRGLSAILILLLFALSACEGVTLPGQEPTATPRPFARFRAEEIISALQSAGLTLNNPESDTDVGRGAPLTFNERVIFEIPRIAPLGGQVLTFTNAEDMQAWEAWIADLRNDPETRRDVVYVYTNQNAMIQLNANLTNAEAAAYRDQFLALQ